MITKQIIKRRVLVNLRKGRLKVIRIEECAATRVGRQCHKRFLRSEVGIVRLQHRLTGINARSSQAGVLGLAARHNGLKTTNVDRINREVGAHGGIHCGAQFRLVFNSRPLHTAAEVKQ